MNLINYCFILYYCFIFLEELEVNEIKSYWELLQILQNKDIDGLPPGGGLYSK